MVGEEEPLTLQTVEAMLERHMRTIDTKVERCVAAADRNLEASHQSVRGTGRSTPPLPRVRKLKFRRGFQFFLSEDPSSAL